MIFKNISALALFIGLSAAAVIPTPPTTTVIDPTLAILNGFPSDLIPSSTTSSTTSSVVTTTVTGVTTTAITNITTQVTSICPTRTRTSESCITRSRTTSHCRTDEWCPDRKCDRELERERELARRRELELIREFDWELQRERDRRCYDKKDDCNWTVTKTCVIDKTPCCLYAWPCPTNTAIFVTSTSIFVVQPTAVVRQDRVDVAPSRVEVAPNRVDVAPSRVDVAPEVRPACTPCTSYVTAVTRPALVCTTMVFCDIAGQSDNCRLQDDLMMERIAARALRDGGRVFVNGELVVIEPERPTTRSAGSVISSAVASVSSAITSIVSGSTVITITGQEANDAASQTGATFVGGLIMLAAAFLFA